MSFTSGDGGHAWVHHPVTHILNAWFESTVVRSDTADTRARCKHAAPLNANTGVPIYCTFHHKTSWIRGLMSPRRDHKRCAAVKVPKSLLITVISHWQYFLQYYLYSTLFSTVSVSYYVQKDVNRHPLESFSWCCNSRLWWLPFTSSRFFTVTVNIHSQSGVMWMKGKFKCLKKML